MMFPGLDLILTPEPGLVGSAIHGSSHGFSRSASKQKLSYSNAKIFFLSAVLSSSWMATSVSCCFFSTSVYHLGVHTICCYFKQVGSLLDFHCRYSRQILSLILLSDVILPFPFHSVYLVSLLFSNFLQPLCVFPFLFHFSELLSSL